MFHSSNKEEQIRDLHIDSFIIAVSLASLGGYSPAYSTGEALEAEKLTIENRLKTEVALESSRKK